MKHQLFFMFIQNLWVSSLQQYNLLFLPRTIWGISWIKIIFIILEWKDPWQLWIPLNPDHSLLASHLYLQNNSIVSAWATPEAGYLHILCYYVFHTLLSLQFFISYYSIWITLGILYTLMLHKGLLMSYFNSTSKRKYEKNLNKNYHYVFFVKQAACSWHSNLPAFNTLDLENETSH